VRLGEPPPPRLSPLRLALFLAVVILAAGGIGLALWPRSPAAAALSVRSSFAPYVDVTLTPTYAFEVPSANPVSNVVLGFVVASPRSRCTPSWGGYYTLSRAESALNLDERISQVRAQGGTPIISYGGRDNTELAVSCTSVPALTAAYRAPIARYSAGAIDLDIEGAALGNVAANERRSLALAAIQRTDPHLKVWLTLPVTPHGLTADALAAISSMLRAHVALTGVNVMAMDFFPAPHPGHGMLGPVESAIDSSHDQLDSVYRSVGLELSSSAIWRHLGATVMIGTNDVASERFTTTDARALVSFAGRRALARVSMWSLNRDAQCGTVFPQTGILSNTCSGVRQQPLAFTQIFSHFAATETAIGTPETPQVVGQVPQAEPDDAATSPYPIWMASAAYVAGYKVVWHRNIYQAQWYTQGVSPDTPAQTAAQTPWLLIGPVLPGAHAPAPQRFDKGRHTVWSNSAVYHSGARVRYHGLPYEAKWYTQGVPPSASLPPDPQSAWLPLFAAPGEPPDPATPQGVP
jgi:chitinase